MFLTYCCWPFHLISYHHSHACRKTQEGAPEQHDEKERQGTFERLPAARQLIRGAANPLKIVTHALRSE